jgi:hypothetical protein
LQKIISKIWAWIKKICHYCKSQFFNFLRILEVAAIVGGVIFAAFQLSDFRYTQSAQFMLQFNQELSTSKNSQLAEAIENNQPVFITNGGKFTTADVDNYLTNYELLNSTFQAGLIDNDMLYNGFSYDLVKTYRNPEIKSYIDQIRKTNNDNQLFAGFEQLAKAVQNAK